jgi:hypothetical protein
MLWSVRICRDLTCLQSGNRRRLAHHLLDRCSSVRHLVGGIIEHLRKPDVAREEKQNSRSKPLTDMDLGTRTHWEGNRINHLNPSGNYIYKLL